ncbi:hypothetical protein E2542_SST02761 [Spatholobus suberectus]|nr:hypothetical protein E2542_SST02761 [Spatholobus suberectus]
MEINDSQVEHDHGFCSSQTSELCSIHVVSRLISTTPDMIVSDFVSLPHLLEMPGSVVVPVALLWWLYLQPTDVILNLVALTTSLRRLLVGLPVARSQIPSSLVARGSCVTLVALPHESQLLLFSSRARFSCLLYSYSVEFQLPVLVNRR